MQKKNDKKKVTWQYTGEKYTQVSGGTAGALVLGMPDNDGSFAGAVCKVGHYYRGEN